MAGCTGKAGVGGQCLRITLKPARTAGTPDQKLQSLPGAHFSLVSSGHPERFFEQNDAEGSVDVGRVLLPQICAETAGAGLTSVVPRTPPCLVQGGGRLVEAPLLGPNRLSGCHCLAENNAFSHLS